MQNRQVGWAQSDASGDLASRVGGLISTWINTTTAAEIVATPNWHQSPFCRFPLVAVLVIEAEDQLSDPVFGRVVEIVPIAAIHGAGGPATGEVEPGGRRFGRSARRRHPGRAQGR